MSHLVLHNPYDTSQVNRQRQQEFLNSFVRPAGSSSSSASSGGFLGQTSQIHQPQQQQQQYMHVNIPAARTAIPGNEELRHDHHKKSKTAKHHDRDRISKRHKKHRRRHHRHRRDDERSTSSTSTTAGSSSSSETDDDFAGIGSGNVPPVAMMYQLQQPDARLHLTQAPGGHLELSSLSNFPPQTAAVPPSPAVVVRSSKAAAAAAAASLASGARAGAVGVTGGNTTGGGSFSSCLSASRLGKSIVDSAVTVHAVDTNTMQWTQLGDETIAYVGGRAIRVATQLGQRETMARRSSSSRQSSAPPQLFFESGRGLVAMTKIMTELNEAAEDDASAVDKQKQQLGIDLLNSKYMAAHREAMTASRGFDRLCDNLLASDAATRSSSVRLALSAVLGAHKALMEWAQLFANAKSAWIADLREGTAFAVLSLLEMENTDIREAAARAQNIVSSSTEYGNRLVQYFRPMTPTEVAFAHSGAGVTTNASGYRQPSPEEVKALEEDRQYIDSTFADYKVYLMNVNRQTAHMYPQISILAAASATALGKGETNDSRMAEALVVVIQDFQEALEKTVQQQQQQMARRRQNGEASHSVAASVRAFLQQRDQYTAAIRAEQAAEDAARKAGEQLMLGWRNATTVQTLDKLHEARSIALVHWRDTKDIVTQLKKLLSDNNSNGVGSASADQQTFGLTPDSTSFASTAAASAAAETSSLIEATWMYHYNVFYTRIARLRQLANGTGAVFNRRMLASDQMPIDPALYYSIQEMISQSMVEAISSLRAETVRKVDFAHKQAATAYKKKIAALRVTCVDLDRLMLERKKTLDNVLMEQKLRLVSVYDITQKEYAEMERCAQYYAVLAMRAALAMQATMNLRQATMLHEAITTVVSSEPWKLLH